MKIHKLPYELVEIIYQFSDIETKVHLSKSFYDLRPLKIKTKNYDSIKRIIKFKKFKYKYNIVLFELLTRRILI